MKKFFIVLSYLLGNYLIVMGGCGFFSTFKECVVGNDFCIQPGWYFGYIAYATAFIVIFILGNILVVKSVKKY